MYTGQVIKSKSVDKNLEIVFIDNLTKECICIEANSQNAERHAIKFGDVLEG